MLGNHVRHAVLRLALAVLVGSTVACGSVALPAPAQHQEVDAPNHPLAAPDAPDASAAPHKRPNVLVIETDDMRWDDLRWMPNVRRLVQRRGLSFENSFAPYPLCCPSRSSFLSGRYTHNHHVYTHLEPYGFAAFPDRRSIATVLQGAGYQTGLVGKYLNGYGEQYLRSGGSSLNYVPPGWDQWYARLGPPVGLRRPEPWWRHLLLQPPGPEHQREDPVLPWSLLH